MIKEILLNLNLKRYDVKINKTFLVIYVLNQKGETMSMSISIMSAEDAVQQGAKFLDKAEPNWDERINLDLLDIRDGTKCILGQLYDSYISGVIRYNMCSKTRSNLGFHYGPLSTYGDLNNEWKKELKRRKN